GRVSVHAADFCAVRTARSLLLVALRNLIDNAMRYAPVESSILVRIECQNDGFACISVLDDGPGLSEEDRVQAVNRLWRGDLRQPGYGLGLSIVSAIARRYGGELELLGRDGRGLEARLSLPLAPKALSFP